MPDFIAEAVRRRLRCIPRHHLGIVGAFIGEIVTSLFGIQGQVGFMGSIMIAFAGATILVAVVRALGI